ncbi:MAG: GNAT family N-acetyltransferase, partial [Bacillota bacterium]|nr:GNAT family N-acetyltransferase [Bacillota bacterium]
EYEELEEIWENIYYNNKDLTPFQSYEWNSNLIKNHIYNGNLNILLLYKNDKPIIIAPLIIKNKIFYNETNLLGVNTHSDYLNIIYDKDLQFEDFNYFLQLLFNMKKFTLINFLQVKESSIIVEYVKKSLYHFKQRKDISIKIPICQNNEEYLSILGKSTKKELKYKQNLADRNLKNLLYKVYMNKELGESLINEMMSLYSVRRIEKNSKLNRQYSKFLEDAMENAKNNFLSLCYVDEKLAAFNWGLISTTNDIYLIIVAIDSNFKKYSIGNLLIYNTLCDLMKENCSNQFKYNYYDLSRGTELYKYKLGGIEHYYYNFIISNKNYILILHELMLKIHRKIQILKTWMRNIVKESRKFNLYN